MIFIVIRVPGMINEIIRYVILRYHVLIRSKNVYIYRYNINKYNIDVHINW